MVVVMADVDITSLSVEISAESQGAELNIDKLATAISNLRTKGNVTKVVNSLDKLASSIATLKQASAGMSGLDKITSFLNGLSNVNTTASAKSINTVVNAIKKIPAAVSGLNGVDFYSMSGSITQLTNALAPLSILDASNLKALGSAFNAIGKVPDLTDKLKATDLDSFASSCQKISAALTPLASQLDKVGNAFAKLPPQLSKVVTQANRVTAANEKQRKSYLSLSNQMNGFMRNMAKLVSLKAIAEYLGNAVAKFNDFYEATDLFHNAMGNLSGEADTLISKMQGLLGVDPTKAMTYMATIQSLGTSFGLTSDKAYVLSKNLTQLAYDEGSYWNKNVAETFTAMSSAISGEIEPIRRLGIDLSQARLQQELLALGFNKQVSSLSQADKAVLRYIAIMKQTSNVQGNLAQTIQSPANQIKILKAQLDMLAKSVGSLLYPALKSILPPLIAAVQLIREFVEWVAKLMGVKVVFTDFSKSADSVGGIGDAMDDTADSTKKAAKALKDYTMGFDELNIIDPTQGSSGSGSGASAGNILGDVDLSGYDMFKNYVGTSIDEMKQKIKSMLPLIESIAAAFALWELGKFIKQIGEVIKGMNGIQKAAAMIATLVVEWTLVQKFSDSFLKTGDVKAFFAEWLTTVAAAIGGYALFGAEGASLALIVSAVAQLESIKTNLSQGAAKATDASVWIQGISAAVTTGIAGAVFTKTATGFSLGLSVGAVLALSAITYGGTKGGSIKPGDSIDMLLTALTAAAGGLAGVTLALAAGASAPIAGAALILGVGVGVVLEQLGITFGEKDRIKDVEDYIKRYEDAGYTTLAIHYRLKNLGFSDDEINMAEQGIDSTFEIFRYTFNEKLKALNEWWNQKWEGFKENFGKSWDSLKNAVSSAKDGLDQASADLKQWFVGVGEWWNQKWSGFKTNWDKSWNSLVDTLKALPKKFLDYGKNIIQGLIDGINKGIENAKKTVGGLAKAIIDKFTTETDIHSPSKVFEQFGIYIDQGLANGIAAAIPYVTTAMQGIANTVQEKGQALIDAGSTQATNYVTGFLNGLDTKWQQIDQSLQSDFFGSIGTLWDAISNGDLEKLGTWAASYFYHAMDDEQRKQIKSIANNSLQWLTQGLSSVWSNIAGMASSFISQFVPSAMAATSAQTSLNIAMDANPVMLVISLIGMLVGALVNFANKNKSIASFLSNLWYGIGDFFSIVFEGILRVLGTAIQGIVAGINALIDARNFFNPFDKWGHISNPLYDWADNVASSRAESQRKRQEAANSGFDDSKDPTDYEQQYKELLEKYKNGSYPGTKEWDKNNGTSSGSYGGTTSVNVNINEEEMRESVYNGTYNAFLDIFQRYGDELTGGKELKIYLDGKQITASVEKRQNARGQSLMGSEVYSY
jgi:soluble cytochrome b562/uncharacterized protein YoxC